MVRYMGNAKEALKRLGKLEEELLRDDNVQLTYVFGSCAHGFITALSDVDVAVILKDSSLKRLTTEGFTKTQRI